MKVRKNQSCLKNSLRGVEKGTSVCLPIFGLVVIHNSLRYVSSLRGIFYPSILRYQPKIGTVASLNIFQRLFTHIILSFFLFLFVSWSLLSSPKLLSSSSNLQPPHSQISGISLIFGFPVLDKPMFGFNFFFFPFHFPFALHLFCGVFFCNLD